MDNLDQLSQVRRSQLSSHSQTTTTLEPHQSLKIKARGKQLHKLESHGKGLRLVLAATTRKVVSHEKPPPKFGLYLRLKRRQIFLLANSNWIGIFLRNSRLHSVHWSSHQVWALSRPSSPRSDIKVTLRRRDLDEDGNNFFD